MPVKRVPRAEREEQMLAAAVRVFAGQGFHGASMDEIARQVGVTKPMLYAYFESKEGLYRSVFERCRHMLITALATPTRRGETGEKALWTLIVSFFEFVQGNQDAWKLLDRETAGRAGDFTSDLEGGRGDAVGLIVGMLASDTNGAPAPPRDELVPLAQAFVGAAEALANWWVASQDDSTDEVSRQLMEFAWVGLRDIRKGRRWHGPMTP